MQSSLSEQRNLEAEGQQRFALQNPQMLRVSLGPDVLSVKGSMVAYQGDIAFNHEGSGSVGKLIRRVMSNEDVPLMRVTGDGEVFFASEAGFVYLIDLTGDALSVNGANMLAFDADISWDVRRTEGAGVLSGGLFNVVLEGQGAVALHAIGQPVVLDCSQQPTCVDVQSAVAWSANLVPQVVSSMNMKSMLRGGTGEAFQYRFHGPGFVVVQPSEWPAGADKDGSEGGQQRGGLRGGLMG